MSVPLISVPIKLLICCPVEINQSYITFRDFVNATLADKAQSSNLVKQISLLGFLKTTKFSRNAIRIHEDASMRPISSFGLNFLVSSVKIRMVLYENSKVHAATGNSKRTRQRVFARDQIHTWPDTFSKKIATMRPLPKRIFKSFFSSIGSLTLQCCRIAKPLSP